MLILIKALSTPVIWIFVLLITGLVMTRKSMKDRRNRAGWVCLLAATVIFYGLSTEPGSRMLCYLLEREYMGALEQPVHKVDAVVVLGGGVLQSNTLRKQATLTSSSWSRLVRGVDSFYSLSADYLVLSGGPNLSGGEDEAQVMRKWALVFGVPEENIIIERKSMDTFQQAVEVGSILSFLKEPVIGLVTSALHMKRSLWCFNRYYRNIVPVPSDFSYDPQGFHAMSFIPSVRFLSVSADSIHEIAGMLWYGVRYKIPLRAR